MSAMDNLRQAARELFGVGDGGEPRDPMESVADEPFSSAPEYETATPQAASTRSDPVGEGIYGATADSSGSAQTQAPEPDSPFAPPQEISVFEPRKDTSVIAKGTTIVGRVRTDGHMEIMGKVEGNIEAEGDVAIQGRVSGNVRGNYLGLYSCQVKGNLNAASGVVISTDSIVVGDIQTESIILDGKLKGNVSAKQTAIFKSNAYLLGDITAHSIAIETGAVINGMVSTVTGFNEDSPFDIF